MENRRRRESKTQKKLYVEISAASSLMLSASDFLLSASLSSCVSIVISSRTLSRPCGPAKLTSKS